MVGPASLTDGHWYYEKQLS